MIRLVFPETASTSNVFFIWSRGKRRNTTCTSVLVSVSLFSTTETAICFIDVSQVPLASSVVYLGALVGSKAKQGHEVSNKIRDARQAFKTLLRVWKHAGIGTKRKINIYYACVVSKLMYSLCTLCFTEKQMLLLDPFHIRCLLSIAGIPSTGGSNPPWRGTDIK